MKKTKSKVLMSNFAKLILHLKCSCCCGKLLTIFNLEMLNTMHLQGLEMFTEGSTVNEEAEATLMMTLLLD